MYLNFLQEIEQREQDNNGKMQPPASAQQIAALSQNAKSKLGVDVPPSFLDFLRLHNGLNWNGLFIYAAEKVHNAGTEDGSIQGVVEENEGYRMDDDKFNDLFVFGDSDISFYVLDSSSNKYDVLDKVSLDRFGSFNSFDELMTEALQTRV